MFEDRIRAKQQRILLEQEQANSDGLGLSSDASSEEAPIGPPNASKEWREFYSAVKRITESMRL